MRTKSKDNSTASQNASGIYDPIRAWAIKWTAAHHLCTDVYVRAIINNPRLDSDRCQAIRKSFEAKYSEIKKVTA